MNAVLISELTHYNSLVSRIKFPLTKLKKALKGEIPMDNSDENLCKSLLKN